MIVDVYEDIRQPRRRLAVRSGEWPHEVVPVGHAGVQLLDYMLVDRDVDLAALKGGRTARARAQVADRGYAFFTALDVVAQAASAPATPASEADALLRRARMLLRAAEQLRTEAARLGRDWSGDVEGLSAALKLERMTEGLAERGRDFSVAGPWLSDAG